MQGISRSGSHQIGEGRCIYNPFNANRCRSGRWKSEIDKPPWLCSSGTMSPHNTCCLSHVCLRSGYRYGTRPHLLPATTAACISVLVQDELSLPSSHAPCLVGKKEQSPDIDDSGRWDRTSGFRPYPAGRSPPPLFAWLLHNIPGQKSGWPRFQVSLLVTAE